MELHDNEPTSPVAGEEIKLPRGRLQPISGWPLRQLGVVEQALPGFLWRAMHTKAQWRQSVFAALASGVLDDPRPFVLRACGDVGEADSWAGLLVQFGEAILRMPPREIIETNFGECPAGLLGAIGKIGFDAMEPPAYLRLQIAFGSDDPETRKRRRCLEQLPLLSEGQLEAAETLDSAILSPSVLGRITSGDAAKRLNAEIAIVRLLCSTANDAAIRSSLDHDQYDRYPGWMMRWLKRADRPLPATLPTDECAFLERVTPASARAIGDAFDNCLGSDPDGLVGMMMSGTFAMVAWRDAGLLVEMMLLEGGNWLVNRIHAKGNAPITQDMRQQVAAALGPLGVMVPIAAQHPSELDAIRQQLGTWRAPVIDVFDLA